MLVKVCTVDRKKYVLVAQSFDQFADKGTALCLYTDWNVTSVVIVNVVL